LADKLIHSKQRIVRVGYRNANRFIVKRVTILHTEPTHLRPKKIGRNL